MPDNNQRNRHKVIGFRPDDSDRRILAAIAAAHGLSPANAIRLAIRTQGEKDGVPDSDPTAFRPPAMGNPKIIGKENTPKTPGKTAISRKVRKSSAM